MRKSVAICILLVSTVSASVHGKTNRILKLDNGMKVVLQPIEGRRNVSITLLMNLGELRRPFEPEALNRLFWMSETKTQPRRDWKAITSSYPLGTLMVNHPSFQSFTLVVPKKRVAEELKHIASRLKTLTIRSQDIRDVDFRNNYRMSISYYENPEDTQRRWLAGHIIEFSTTRPDHSASLNSWLGSHMKPANAILVLAGAVETDDQDVAVFNGLSSGRRLSPATYSDERDFSGRRIYGDRSGRKTTFPFYWAHRTPDPNQQQVLTMGYLVPVAGERLFPSSLVAVARLKSDLKRKARSASGIYQPLSNPGLLFVELTLPNDTSEGDVDKARSTLRKVVYDSANDRVTLADLKRAKKEFALTFSTSSLPANSRLAHIGFATARRLQLGVRSKQLTKDILNVSSQDLYFLAKKAFKREGASYHIYPELISKERWLRIKKALRRNSKRSSEELRLFEQ